MADLKRFPVLGARNDVQRGEQYPASVSWEYLKPFEAQAKNNHGQSLSELAQRGGLSPAELYCVINKKDLREGMNEIGSGKKAIEWIKDQSLAAEWRVR